MTMSPQGRSRSGSSVSRLGVRAGAGLLVAACLALAGCNHSMADLRAYVQRVLARKSTKVEPLPEIKPYEVYTYQSAKAKDPFKPFYQQESEHKKQAQTNNGIHPDFNRNKEALEAFSLDSLRMVGTLEEDHHIWGIVQSPDGVIHRVQVGNYMGKNYGHIKSIQDDRINLVEIIPNGQGGWRERPASLALSQ